jgi:DNA-directed RNA polymerase
MSIELQDEDLMETQLRLEEEMTLKGAEKYIRDVSNAVRRQNEENTAYGQAILANRLERLSLAIGDWKETVGAGVAGRFSTSYPLIKEIPNNTLAFIALKNVMAGVSSLRTLQHVGVTIGTAVEDEVRFAGVREQERREYDSIMEGASKRSSYKYKHIYSVRRADRFSTWERWSKTDRLHVGVKLLDLVIASVGLVEITHQKADKNKSIKFVKALPDTLGWIEKKNEIISTLRPAYEPMVVQPRDWTDPFNGGYISSNIRPLKLVKTRSKGYLDELENIDMPIVYSAVNALQHTPWQINSQVLAVMETLWETGSSIAGLPPRDGMEMPPKPHDIDTNAEAKREWRIQAAKIHTQNLSMMGQRVGFNMALGIAKRYEPFRKIYFPYQLDFRGRIYAVPHLNPQGADYHKALLRFANGKPMGEEGWKWLAIQGANLAGNDKVSLEERVNWVLDNEDEIVGIANDPYSNKGWCGSIAGVEIDKPWQFLAFCFEWKGYVEHGDAFVSKLPVAMDGSCSGIQHFSAMLRDHIGGKAVNLIPAELPQDVYQLVANKVLEQIAIDLETGTPDEVRHTEQGTAYVRTGTKNMAQQWLDFGITRKVTKRSVMTLAYGSKEYGFKEQLMEDIIRPAKQACDRAGKEFVFQGDGYQAAQYMAKAIWVAVNQVLVKAGEAMKWLQSAASIAASEELPVRWTTPVGFPVMQAYPDLEKRKVKTSISGKLVYLTMYRDKDNLDRRRQSQGIAPNFVHSCDAAHMMLTVVRAEQAGIKNFAMIHDSFGTVAGDTEELFHIVRESFVEMYGEIEVLESFRDEICNKLSDKNLPKVPPLPTKGELDLSQVVHSRYCFA